MIQFFFLCFRKKEVYNKEDNKKKKVDERSRFSPNKT